MKHEEKFKVISCIKGPHMHSEVVAHLCKIDMPSKTLCGRSTDGWTWTNKYNIFDPKIDCKRCKKISGLEKSYIDRSEKRNVK